MTGPIERTVKRYVCPHCSRGRSTRRSAVRHIAQCWRNPANRSCKTCAWYQPIDHELDEACSKGVVIGKDRERAIEQAWAEYGASWSEPGGAPRPVDDQPTPFPLNCDLWEAS